VLAIAVGIAFGSAAAFGVSFALGAFFAGVIMGESHLAHRAAANSLPLQDAFSVLFFVSIGMLFDPTIMMREPEKVVLTLALIVLGKSVISFLIVVLLRYPIGMAIGIAAGRSQIGEFSFILAGLGMAHGLMSDEGQDLILAGAILSITINPLVLNAAAPLQRFAQTRWPTFYASYGKGRSRLLHIDLERNRAHSEERERKQQQKITDLLGTFPLFSGIDKHGQEELLLLFRPRSASPGERVIRKGERGSAMFFIVSGEVEVDLGERVVPLHAGSFFGEMALLSGERRTADITAVDFCQFLVLERRDFNLFMARHPGLRAVVSEMAEQRRAMNQGDPREGSKADV
jgi:monovalent cation:H+ antiporter-2, CPA2 family